VIELSKFKYNEMVSPTTSLAKEIGNTYTASLWGSLVSLVANKGEGLAGGKVGMFSYGSGLCSSMFVLSVPSSTSSSSSYEEGKMKLETMRKNLDLFGRLQRRREITPQAFTDILERRTRHYGTNVIPSAPSSSALSPGTFYLTEIDQLWRRSYNRSSISVTTSLAQSSSALSASAQL
jgi:hydroxymethylglutaryl-CoA synthase